MKTRITLVAAMFAALVAIAVLCNVGVLTPPEVSAQNSAVTRTTLVRSGATLPAHAYSDSGANLFIRTPTTGSPAGLFRAYKLDTWAAISVSINPTPKTTSYAYTPTDSALLFDATGGVLAPTLPAASSVPTDWRACAKKTDASVNAVTLTRSGSDTIDGATTFALAAQNKYVCVQPDGVSKYFVLSNN